MSGPDTPELSPASPAQRMLNIGKPMYHKKTNQTLTVRELSLEAIVQGASDIVMLLSQLDLQSNVDTIAIISLMLKKPEVMEALRVFAAASTDTTPNDWTDCGAGDWSRFIRAAKEVNDWEELRELFTEAGLIQLFQKADSPANIPASPQDESKTTSSTPLPS